MKGVQSIMSRRILGAAAIFCGLLLVFIDAKFGIIRPFPDAYDETKYVNDVCADRSIAVNQGLVGFAKGVLSEDRIRPPAYRLAGFLVGLASEPSPAMLRWLSLLSLFVTALLLFVSGTEISGTHAGILWGSAFSFSVGVFSTVLNFGTETTLYPAIAGCLYAVARWFHRVRPDAVTVGVLAFSTALGSLSKVSFFFVIVPLIGAALLVTSNVQPRRSLLAILGAVAGGLLVTIPWWVVNWWSALGYAYWVRHFPGANYPWLTEAATNLLGVPFSIGLLAFLGWILVRANSLWKILNRATWNFIAVCLCGCLPLIALQIVSTNHNVRLITPALIPGMGVIAVLLNSGSLLKRRAVSALIGLLFVIQIGTIAWHMSQSIPQDPWDWGELRELTRANGLPNPTIVVVGEMPTLNPPQIQYPWLCHGETLFEPLWLLPERLWGSKDRAIDWSQVNSLIEQADIVLTAPGRLFQSSLDGQINDELARQLRERSDIWMLVNLYLGIDSKTAISVFLRKRVQ
jgi:4-amino-4-deoxy-L-arabinose transferase-like glycosyltransferase